MKKSLMLFAMAVSGTALWAAPYFVSHQGGLWSAPSTWEKAALPKPPVELRMSHTSGNLEVDAKVDVANISVWGKPQNIHILEGSQLTLSLGGFNMQKVNTCVSGAGFFKCQSNTLVGYGGDGGTLFFVSNAQFDKILFNNDRKLIKNLTVSMNQPIDRVFKTTEGKDGKYNPLSIVGVRGVKTRVCLCGNTTVGDINLSNNANLLIDTSRLFMRGTYRKIEVASSTLELVRNGEPYNISSKVRLNGSATLKLSGDRPYVRPVNILFLSGQSNTIEINGRSELMGLTIYDNGKKTGRNVNIVLPKKSSGVVLELNSLVVCPAAKLCLADNSLSQTGAGAKVDDVTVTFVNYRNGAVKLRSGLKNPADYAKIKAAGYKNFRLEKGFLVADKQ